MVQTAMAMPFSNTRKDGMNDGRVGPSEGGQANRQRLNGDDHRPINQTLIAKENEELQ